MCGGICLRVPSGFVQLTLKVRGVEFKRSALDKWLKVFLSPCEGIIGTLIITFEDVLRPLASRITIQLWDVWIIVQPFHLLTLMTKIRNGGRKRKKEKLKRAQQRWEQQMHRMWTGRAREDVRSREANKIRGYWTILRFSSIDFMSCMRTGSDFSHPYTVGVAADKLRFGFDPEEQIAADDPREKSSAAQAAPNHQFSCVPHFFSDREHTGAGRPPVVIHGKSRH